MTSFSWYQNYQQLNKVNMIVIIVIFLCSTIYYIIRSKKITDIEFSILSIIFILMLLFLNKNELKEKFVITEGDEDSTKNINNDIIKKINIDKEKIFNIANKVIDKSIILYEKSLLYIEKQKIKERLNDAKKFIKNRIALMKNESRKESDK